MTNRLRREILAFAVSAMFSSSCGSKPQAAEIHVAAAANLRNVFDALSRDSKPAAGVTVVPTFGSTAQLAQQIENGAPVDLFLAADTEHVDQLIAKGIAVADSRAVYARGRLVLWAPNRPDIQRLEDLARPDVRQVGIARPELAPYGAAAVEALKKQKLWTAVEPKLVYAQSISASRQFADSGNTDAAFTAYSLVIGTPGHFVFVDEKLHAPIEQALCVTKTAAQNEAVREFRTFLLSTHAREIWTRFGYTVP